MARHPIIDRTMDIWHGVLDANDVEQNLVAARKQTHDLWMSADEAVLEAVVDKPEVRAYDRKLAEADRVAHALRSALIAVDSAAQVVAGRIADASPTGRMTAAARRGGQVRPSGLYSL